MGFGRILTRASRRRDVHSYDDLDMPLLQLSGARGDAFTRRDAMAGVHVTGTTGSGKTSGSGAAIIGAYLRDGYGGVAHCAKPGEYGWVMACARRAGREQDVIRFGPDSGLRFNPLDYQIASDIAAGRGMVTMNVVNLMMKILEAAQRGNELRGQAAEQSFWRYAPQELMSHSFDALYAAYGTIRIPDFLNFILTVPQSEEEFRSEAFQRSSFHLQTIRKMVMNPVHRLSDADADVVMSYFRFNFGRLDNRTRSNIVTTLTAQLAPLLKGVMRDIFCAETTILPELTFTAGAIIVLDFPVKTYGDAGLLAQHIFKFLWQKAVESRDVREYPRPVFLWADEAQFFVTPYDLHFLTTARSSRACTVYLTQTYCNYYAVIGGNNPKDAVQAVLANFNTKIAHLNTDVNTNQALADLIGRSIQLRGNRGINSGGSHSRQSGENSGSSTQAGHGGSHGGSSQNLSWNSGGGTSHGYSLSDSLSDSWGQSSGVSEVMDYEIQPGDFARLPTGPENGWCTDAIWFQSGKRFAANGDRNYLHLSFPIIRE